MVSETLEQTAILVVDDDQGVTETFARMLRLEGYTVYTAVTPESGLAMATDKRPQAIILDLRMPLVNGIQFLRQLRARPGMAHTPVAVVTGDYFLDRSVTEQLQRLGASVQFKPLWLEDLVSIARRLVASPAGPAVGS